jgi:hypothetical protein
MFVAVADMRVNLLPTTSHMMHAGYTAAVCITGRSLSLEITGMSVLVCCSSTLSWLNTAHFAWYAWWFRALCPSVAYNNLSVDKRIFIKSVI